MTTEDILKKVQGFAFYVVVNSEGQFFRRKGYGGGGDTWVEGLTTARVYVSLSAARGTVSYFANQFPNYPTPSLVKMTIGGIEVMDEGDRVKKMKERKKEAANRRVLWRKEQALKAAQADLEEAKRQIRALGGEA